MAVLLLCFAYNPKELAFNWGGPRALRPSRMAVSGSPSHRSVNSVHKQVASHIDGDDFANQYTQPAQPHRDLKEKRKIRPHYQGDRNAFSGRGQQPTPPEPSLSDLPRQQRGNEVGEGATHDVDKSERTRKVPDERTDGQTNYGRRTEECRESQEAISNSDLVDLEAYRCQ